MGVANANILGDCRWVIFNAGDGAYGKWSGR